MKAKLNTPSQQSGISYVEVLAAVIIVAVSVIPATNAIRGALDVAEADNQATVNHYHLMSKMEEVLAEPFADVAAAAAGPGTATVYSDPPGPDRRLVFIAPYDGDNADADTDPFTGGEPDLLWVRVEIEGSVRFLQALNADQ